MQGAADRVFYESLFREKGSSCEMALIWCVEHGVFMGREIDERFKEYTRVKSGGGGAVRKIAAPAPSGKARAAAGAGKIIGDEVVDAGLSVGGTEGIGRVTV